MMRVAGDDAPATSSGTGPPKVFVLRHEKRDPTDPRFFTHLTEEGMVDAAKTVSDNLHDLGITKIYASPFLRVLQTVEPFARRKGLLVRVDYSLYEHPEPNDEPVTALPAEFHERFPIDAAFASTLDGKRIGAHNADATASSSVLKVGRGEPRRGRARVARDASDELPRAHASSEWCRDRDARRRDGVGV